MRLPAAVALAGLALFATGGRAVGREHHEHHEHKADAKHHLERANALAGEGKCAEAVKEFTAAYDKLQDPIVLFNRAECYRRLGENAKAAEDYRGFLAGFPAAPNRKDIEAKIAALEKPAPRAPAPAVRPTVPTPPPVARTPVAPAPPPPRAPAPVAQAPAHTAPPPPVVPEPMPFLPPPPGAGETKTMVEAPHATTPTEPPRTEASHGSRWWLWTGLAVVVVGGGVAGYLYTRPKDQPLPMTTLGNFRF
jgi:hypothetical protein